MGGYMTYSHAGIILVFIGTVLLAFSLKVKRSYESETADVVDKLKKQFPHILEPTEVYIRPGYFRSGLIFVAIGSLLQW